MSASRPRSRSRVMPEVELAGDAAALLDVDLPHPLALRAGLGRPELHPQHGLRRSERASSGERASFTPPPLPRPPAWICALTTQVPRELPRGRLRVLGGAGRGCRAGPPPRSVGGSPWPGTRGSSCATPAQGEGATPRGRGDGLGHVASVHGEAGPEAAGGRADGFYRSTAPSRRPTCGRSPRTSRTWPARPSIELDLEDALHAAGADHHRHADEEPLTPYWPVEQRRAGEDPLAVAEVGLGHGDGRDRRGVEGGAGAQQLRRSRRPPLRVRSTMASSLAAVEERGERARPSPRSSGAAGPCRRRGRPGPWPRRPAARRRPRPPTKYWKRAVSRTPAMPTTRFLGNPVTLCMA